MQYTRYLKMCCVLFQAMCFELATQTLWFELKKCIHLLGWYIYIHGEDGLQESICVELFPNYFLDSLLLTYKNIHCLHPDKLH